MINADLVVKALFGVRYIDAATVFVLFNSFVFLRVITFGLALRAMNKTHIEFMLTLIYLLFSVVGSYFMVNYYNIEGAAIWVIVNTIILSLALSLYTLRFSGGRLSMWRIYPVKLFIVGFSCFLVVFFRTSIFSFFHPLMASAFYSILVIIIWLGILRFIIREEIA